MAIEKDSVDRIIINSFATECLRNVADADYISSRMCYRLGLMQQFQWAALQAIEKYLKAILLYNSKKAKGLSHDIEKALRRVESIKEFDIDLEDYQRKLIRHLNENGQNRYFEQHSFTRRMELLQLDGTIWSIRRYCQVINRNIIKKNGVVVNILDLRLKNLHLDFYREYPHKFRINGGFLESVLKRKKSDDLRKALVWNNFYYGDRRKKTISNFTLRSGSVNPPHIREPSRFKVLKNFVDFPARIKKLFNE